MFSCIQFPSLYFTGMLHLIKIWTREVSEYVNWENVCKVQLSLEEVFLFIEYAKDSSLPLKYSQYAFRADKTVVLEF